MIFRIVFIMLGATMLYGCGTNTATHSLATQFQPKEAMYIFTVGRGAIIGQAFVRTSNGKTHVAANSVVTLVPATAYAQERINAIYRGRRGAGKNVRFPNADPRYSYFTRKTTTNAKGEFKFIDISDGDYFVTTNVVWGKGRKRARAVVTRTSVSNSAKVKITLSERVS